MHEEMKFCLEVYKKILPEVLEEHEGKWAVIKKDSPLGYYKSQEEGYCEGAFNYGGNAYFLVKKVDRGDLEKTLEEIKF